MPNGAASGDAGSSFAPKNERTGLDGEIDNSFVLHYTLFVKLPRQRTLSNDLLPNTL
jgi:hypothetical protein